jgi:RNA polymerase sigma-70 factor (ECF subfamily)
MFWGIVVVQEPLRRPINAAVSPPIQATTHKEKTPEVWPNKVTPQIIQRAKSGDKQAITVIYQANVDKVFRYLVQRVDSDMTAEDLTAEVFVRMVKDLPRYRVTGAPFEAWLYQIAFARIIDYRRQRSRDAVDELDEHLTEPEIGPEDKLVVKQELISLKHALAQLSQQDQLVLTLRFVERKSHKEVANMLGKKINSVRSMQHRALAKLANAMRLEEAS